MNHIGIYSLVVCIVLLAAGCAAPSRKIVKTEAGQQETIKTQVETRETVRTEVEAEQQGPSINLELKFVEADSTTYRVALENDKSVQWEGGASKPPGFEGGHTGNKMEITFTQQIQSVDDQGNATARITIKALKYMVTIKNNVTMDFDSSRQEDRSSPLSKLIGQSYTIEITPSGLVSKVSDTNDALAAVKGDSAANNVAVRLLSADAIKEQHTIPSLPAAGKSQTREGDNWSSLKRVSFDLMGAKSYEKVYTLKEITDVDNRRLAVAEMEAVASAEDAKQLHRQQAATAGPLSAMSDSTEEYTGRLELDVTEGKVQECHEKLLVEWFIVNPNPKADEPPAALRMAARRLYSIERVD
ncbi:MAG: hypothetical protein AMJ65_17895 [Phycisphaerae bacterium SG8_4]|nr:MAG: hypothetical protein AMJ65_17895 [Phycisphaerae bacterium SG8_4]